MVGTSLENWLAKAAYSQRYHTFGLPNSVNQPDIAALALATMTSWFKANQKTWHLSPITPVSSLWTSHSYVDEFFRGWQSDCCDFSWQRPCRISLRWIGECQDDLAVAQLIFSDSSGQNANSIRDQVWQGAFVTSISIILTISERPRCPFELVKTNWGKMIDDCSKQTEPFVIQP